MKYAYRICPCHEYDVEGIQTWLEDLALDGLWLEKQGIFAGIMSFEQTTPQRVKYRLEAIRGGSLFSNDGQPQAAFLSLAEELGWEYVCRKGAFDVFRSVDPNARELNTDPEIQAMTLKHLRKQQIANFIFELIYLALMTFLRRWSWFQFYYSAIAVGPLATVLFSLFLLYALILPFTNLFYLHRLRRKLGSGLLLNGQKAWRPFARLKTAGKLLPSLFFCLSMLLLLHSLILVGVKQDIQEYPQDPPFITLTDLADREDTAEYDTFMDYYYNKYTFFPRSVAPVNLEWTENITFTRPDGSTYSGHMIVSYHETCGEWFAQGLADDYYAKDRYRYDRFQELEAPDMGVDSIRVYSNYSLYVLIQHDNVVVQAIVSLDDGAEEAAWLRWAEAMTERLLNGGN